ncbi:MAG TPA: DUF1343 domain-containing protein [Terriglobales bacterium]|nr:DUF1343 domain-containing protein [Terriglobales bacterium]
MSNRLGDGIRAGSRAAGLGAAALLLLILGLGGCSPERRPAAPAAPVRVRTGLEVFLERNLGLVEGKRVGLITNPTGIDAAFRSTVDLLARNPKVKLVALYGPEHGVRGDAQAGEYVPYYFDRKAGLPVFSLYGQSMKPEPGMLKRIDEFMRSYDTRSAGKVPEKDMVQGVDVMIYDIQDVGTRVYTYIATMAYAMQACAENGIDFIVLDRPDPIGGADVEGPVLEYPAYSSPVGLYPVPERFGMTMGELARLFNDRFLAKKANLTVIPMEGWTRAMWFDRTGLPWVMPSPNMPTLDTAAVYPGFVAFEGTNVSEGRGTTRPFELFGAPWVDGDDLAAKLNGLGLPGVIFRGAWFTPTFSKFAGRLCGGCQVQVIDRAAFRSFEAFLQVVKAIRDAAPDKFEFHKDYFDKVMGTSRVREALEAGTPVKTIVDGLKPGLDAFLQLRRPYLLYK